MRFGLQVQRFLPLNGSLLSPSLEFFPPSTLSSSFTPSSSSFIPSPVHRQIKLRSFHGQDMKVMIKRNGSSSSSNTDGRRSESTSCNQMKSNSNGSFDGSEKGDSPSLECGVTRNGSIESTEKLIRLDVTDEVIMMKKAASSSLHPSNITAASSSSHPSAPISPCISPSNIRKKGKNHRIPESNSKEKDIMTTKLPSEEEHSIEVGEEEGFASCSENAVGWHPHVYQETPKKLTAFSILDILNRDTNSSSGQGSVRGNNNNNNNLVGKKKKTCNNKLNPKERSSSTQNSSSAHHIQSSPSVPPSIVPSSGSCSSISASPLLLHQLHQNKSTKPAATLSPLPRSHSAKLSKKKNLSLQGSNATVPERAELTSQEKEEQGDHYQVCHSLQSPFSRKNILSSRKNFLPVQLLARSQFPIYSQFPSLLFSILTKLFSD